MTNLQIEGLKDSLFSMLGDLTIQESSVPIESFQRPHVKPTKAVRKEAGFYIEGDDIVLYFTHGSRYVVLTLRRANQGFSNREKKLFRPFSKIMAPLRAVAEYGFGRSVEAILSFQSFEHLLVAASMRGGAASLSTITLPILALALMQRLAGTSYEGHPCTSGIVFVKKMARFMADAPSEVFDFEPLTEPVELALNHFASPASYRYIDGRNSFYVLSRDTRVHGVVRLRDPRSFGLTERAGADNIASLLSSQFVPWVMYIGQNADVNVVLSNHTAFRFIRSHWRYIENERLIEILLRHGLARELADILNRLICAISDMRVGTLILLPDVPEVRPKLAGSVDTSSIADKLRSTILGKNITELSKQSRALGILASDGLTTIGRDGRIIGTGEIVDLATPAQNSLAGGGRTQAAISASQFGISVKVSEDGPVSVFRKGTQILRIER